MIERRPVLDFLSHVVLVLGVLIVFFPLYVACFKFNTNNRS